LFLASPEDWGCTPEYDKKMRELKDRCAETGKMKARGA
jgi:hypothetical protein